MLRCRCLLALFLCSPISLSVALRNWEESGLGLRFEFFGKSRSLSLSPSLSSGIYIDGSTLRGESNGLDSDFTCLTELPQFLWHNVVLVDSWAWIIPSPASSFVQFVEAQSTTPPKFCKEK